MFIYLLFINFKDFLSQTYVEKARASLSEGKFSEAISFYDKAIIENPNNYHAYFLRGSLNEVLGKIPNSITDLNKCIQINPDFHKAKINRAQIFIKQGELDNASKDLNDIIISKTIEFRDKANDALKTVEQLKGLIKQYKDLISKKSNKNALEITQKIVELMPFDIKFKRARVELLEILKSNDLENELKSLSQLIPNDFELHIKLAKINFDKGEIDDANNYLSKCLQRDPDHTGCRTQFKKIKNIKKIVNNLNSEFENENFHTALTNAKKLMTEKEVPQFFITHAHSYICRVNNKLKKYKESIEHCNKVIEKWPNNVDDLFARGDSYENLERYDEAKEDYNRVTELERNHKKAHDGLRRIENILKKINRPDYYKILNVSKTATTQEINKSYRELVRKFHPDHQKNEADIAEANKKLQEFNRARQVLTDENNRKRYDEGFDPMDPTDGQQRDGHHYGDSQGSFFNFFRGGNPFGDDNGGGGQYRFFFG